MATGNVRVELVFNPKLPQAIWCGTFDPHEEHDYPLDFAEQCSGVLPCGEQIHEEHTIVINKSTRCLGICSCSTPARKHAPSLHDK